MKTILLTSLLTIFICSVSFAQDVFEIPAQGDSLIEIGIPTSSWTVGNENGLFVFTPTNIPQNSLFKAVIMPCQDQSSATAGDDIVNASLNYISTIFEDIVWEDATNSFENSGITFVKQRGSAMLIGGDQQSARIPVNIVIFSTPNGNLLSLIHYGTTDNYSNLEESLNNIIMSITPVEEL